MDLNKENSRVKRLAPTIVVALTLSASAIEPVIVKLGLVGQATAFQLLVLKSLFGLAFMLPLCFKLRHLTRNEWRNVLWLSGMFLATYALMYAAIARTAVITVATIVTVTPAIVALVNVTRGTVETSGRFWFALGAAALGVLLTLDSFALGIGAFSDWGVVLAIGAAVTSALYRTRMDIVTRSIPPFVISGYLFLINGIAAAACLPWLGEVPQATWAMAVWLGLAAAAANITFIKAIHLIGSTRLSVLSLLQRPLVIVVAAIVLGETLTSMQLSGVVLVIAGIQYAKPKRRPLPLTSEDESPEGLVGKEQALR